MLRPFRSSKSVKNLRRDSAKSEQRQTYSMSQSSGEIALKEMWMRPKIVGIVGGPKVEAFEHLENILSLKKSKSQEEE
jgi:hypothetical protein